MTATCAISKFERGFVSGHDTSELSGDCILMYWQTVSNAGLSRCNKALVNLFRSLYFNVHRGNENWCVL